jgi:hypothetical protein
LEAAFSSTRFVFFLLPEKGKHASIFDFEHRGRKRVGLLPPERRVTQGSGGHTDYKAFVLG